MPNFQEKVQKWGLEGDLDTIRQADGKYYMLPGIYEKMRYDYSIALRSDILEDLGLEEPKTWDDFRTVLEEIKEEKGTKYVFSDRWKGEALLNVAAASFNTVAGWGFGAGVLFDESQDEFYFAGSSDDYKAMVEYFAGLVQDGLLDPESFTQEDDQADQKLANEQSFAITTNGQELLRERTVLEATKGDDFQLDKIRVPAGPAGDYMPRTTRTLWRCFSSSIGCTTPTRAWSLSVGAWRARPSQRMPRAIVPLPMTSSSWTPMLALRRSSKLTSGSSTGCSPLRMVPLRNWS
jgi:putative aldouronate transport system substrate-binding protein